MTSPVVFGINSSAACGLNVPGTAALTEPDHLPVPSWVDRTAGMGGERTSGYWSHRQCGAQFVSNLTFCDVGSSYSEEPGVEIL